MKEKRVLLTVVVLLIFLILFVTSYVSAAVNDSIEVSYTCLKNKLGTDCGNTQNTEQAAFSLLAMAYDSQTQSDCKSSLKNKKNPNNCWGETSSSQCNIKSTSQAILAFNYIGEDNDAYITWLLGKKSLKTGLSWFLEIDAGNKTNCIINGREFTITETKKITGSDPAGLIKSYNGYWFEITDINKNYTISCDSDFTTTLLYKKPGSNVIFVPSDSHMASAHDSTNEAVQSYCFTTTSECDYEGTLWASLALAKEGKDISPYLPYLSAMSDETSIRKYFPAAFLYMLTGADDYYSEIKILQQGKYWDVSKRKFYDTGIALLALQGYETEEADNAKKYLLSQRDSSGCWGTDTAFLLYAGWPKMPEVIREGTSISGCEDFSHFCTSASECALENQLENFYCPGSQICCSIKPIELSCSEKEGIVCQETEKCSGDEVIASDTNYCCQGSCQEVTEELTECEGLNYNCRTTCSTNEEEKSLSCNFGEKCCAAKTAKKSNWLLIILLIILIILIILAIIFRNQLKIWLFRMKSGFKSGKAPPPSSRPLVSTQFRPRPMPPRPSTTHLYQRAPPRGVVKTTRDKEFEDTMRKLKEMSK